MTHLRTLLCLCLFLCSLASPSHAKTVDVILNDEIVPLGMLEEVLLSEGYEINRIEGRTLNLSDALKRNADLLVILGGRQSVTRLHENPHFYDEISLIRARNTLNRPTLGLCLGAQMMALAFGGNVVKGPVVEQGWIQLELASKDLLAVKDLVNSGTHVYASHEDIIEVPPNATLHAKSIYNHIFTVGKNTVAIQFHPEATPQITKRWLQLFNDSQERIQRLHQENEIMFSKHHIAIKRFLISILRHFDSAAGSQYFEWYD